MTPYYTNADPKTSHMAFVGRWCPLHRGHTWIIEKKIAEHNKPVLILVRDTSLDEFPAEIRAEMVKIWMKVNFVRGTIQIIPDISGVYYGRGVGYDVEEIEPPDDIRTISATRIRRMMKADDPSWEEMVAPGTADYIREIFL